MADRSDQFKLNYLLETLDNEPCAYVDAEAGRLSADNLQRLVADFHSRTVFVCGPEPYMVAVKALLGSLNFNMAQFNQESFGAFNGDTATSNKTSESNDKAGFMLRIGDSSRKLSAKQTVLEGIEAEGLPIIAACRSGVCGACKCKVLEGQTESSSDMSLTADEIAQGYVLACSTTLNSNVTLAL